MTIKQSLKYFLTALLLGFIFISSPSFAQTTPDSGRLHLILSPYVINLATPPGKPISTVVKIQNVSNTREYLQTGLMKFTAYNDTGLPKIMDREPGDDFFDWISFSEDKFYVEPMQWKSITVTLSPPATASFGYYYVVSFSRVSENRTPGDRQTALSGAPSLLALLDVQVPGAVRNLNLLEFTTDKKLYEYLPTNFLVRMQNNGNVHLIPHGDVYVDQGKKTDLAVLSVNPTNGNILPNSNRVFTVSWTDGFPSYVDKVVDGKTVLDSENNPVKTLKWDFNQISKFRIGKYTAHVLMIFDNGKQDVPLEADTSFWVFPWKLILLALIVLVLFIAGIWQMVKPVSRRVFGWPRRR